MSEGQHSSTPGAAGSVSVSPQASIHLTRAQYYIRLAGAFVVGAAVGAGAAYALKAALSSEEPPIRVRPGSVELQLPSGKKWQAKPGYWQIKNGEKTDTHYELVITTTAPDDNCKLAVRTNKFKITDFESASQSDWFIVAIVNKRTRVTASDPRKVSLSPDKRVLSISTGGYINEFWDEAAQSSICRFGKDQFVGAAVY